jgi:rare lipoprotein A
MRLRQTLAVENDGRLVSMKGNLMTRTFTIGLALAALVSSAAVAQAPAPAAKSEPAPAAAAPAAAAPAPAAAPSGDHRMEGLAAYYSNRLNGRRTANGQVFDQNALTAAHPTLPYGTKVKVTNTKNGKSVVVRINDRGPTQPGRVIDLTRAAAGRLGMLRAGLAPVKLEIVAEAPAKKSKK